MQVVHQLHKLKILINILRATIYSTLYALSIFINSKAIIGVTSTELLASFFASSFSPKLLILEN